MYPYLISTKYVFSVFLIPMFNTEGIIFHSLSEFSTKFVPERFLLDRLGQWNKVKFYYI
jgi:hypothetical protein